MDIEDFDELTNTIFNKLDNQEKSDLLDMLQDWDKARKSRENLIKTINDNWHMLSEQNILGILLIVENP